MSTKEFRHIVRIAGKDLDGTLKLNFAVANINGIGIPLANAITRKANIPPETRVGFLTEIDVERLEDIVTNPSKHGIPAWMLNRAKDMETGKDIHLIGADLTLKIKTDIEEMKDIKSWRGYRHAYGLRVRGQHTKTTGRSGKAMGVKKKDLIKRGAAAT
ncbi:MAG TPA: 30S ribosomal protein S13 [Candidatus Bathyarchaeia archaeon]|nr:30S ribosomal protein S13 [Candidatus Bathyarchaeia archaeon]